MERRRILENEVESVMSEEYELVGTASITEETKAVEIQLSKACTELYLFCENLKSTANSQLVIKLGNGITLSGINAELSQNGQNTIQHIKKVGKTWIRTGNNHGTYGLNVASTQMYRMALGQVDAKLVVSASVLAGILSLLTSIAGLPECNAEGE